MVSTINSPRTEIEAAEAGDNGIRQFKYPEGEDECRDGRLRTETYEDRGFVYRKRSSEDCKSEFILVPGWKWSIVYENEEGEPVMDVEPIEDEGAIEGIRQLLEEDHEGMDIRFW